MLRKYSSDYWFCFFNFSFSYILLFFIIIESITNLHFILYSNIDIKIISIIIIITWETD